MYKIGVEAHKWGREDGERDSGQVSRHFRTWVSPRGSFGSCQVVHGGVHACLNVHMHLGGLANHLCNLGYYVGTHRRLGARVCTHEHKYNKATSDKCGVANTQTRGHKQTPAYATT